VVAWPFIPPVGCALRTRVGRNDPDMNKPSVRFHHAWMQHDRTVSSKSFAIVSVTCRHAGPDRRQRPAIMAFRWLSPGVAHGHADPMHGCLAHRRGGCRAPMHPCGATPLPIKKRAPFAVKQFMTYPSISCPARPHRRSAEGLAWLLLTGWLTSSGFALAGHMLDKPADLCTSPRTPTATNKVSP